MANDGIYTTGNLKFDALAFALLSADDGDPAGVGEVAIALQKENAAEFAAQAAQESVAEIPTQVSADQDTSDLPVCQEFGAQDSATTLADLEAMLDQASAERLTVAENAIAETRARHARENDARENTLSSATARVVAAKDDIAAVNEKAAALTARANLVLDGDRARAACAQIAASAAAERRICEGVLADAEAAVAETRNEIAAARFAAALELQLDEQGFERLAAAMPQVVANLHRAERAAAAGQAALAAVQRGEIEAARVALDNARESALSADKLAEIEAALTSAQRAQALRALRTRAERVLNNADQVGVIGVIAQLEREAHTLGVATEKYFARAITGAYKKARAAKHARRVQALPLVQHLESDGFVTVASDGRIEAWQETGNGHGAKWTLDRVLVWDNGTWMTTTPQNRIVRRTNPAIENPAHTRGRK